MCTCFFFSGYGQPHLFLTDATKDDIFKMSLTEGSLVPLNVSMKTKITFPYGIAYDAANQCLYWTDISLKRIGQLSLIDQTVQTMNLSSGKQFFVLVQIAHTCHLIKGIQLPHSKNKLIEAINFVVQNCGWSFYIKLTDMGSKKIKIIGTPAPIIFQ